MNNRASANGGGIDMGGVVTVSGSSFIGNVAGWRGGGINTYGGTLSVSTSSFIGNTAGMYGGGLSNDASTGTVTSCTFSGNSTAGPGGGVEFNGASGGLTLTNTTVTGNTATTDGGGIFFYPGSTVGVNLVNSTITDNTASGSGGNIYTGGRRHVQRHDCRRQHHRVGRKSHELQRDRLVAVGLQSGEREHVRLHRRWRQANTNPNLTTLQDNTGPTRTRVPLPGSPAIDAGNGAIAPATDQRGLPRTMDGDGNGTAVVDIGAVETLSYSSSGPASASATATSTSQVAAQLGGRSRGGRLRGLAELAERTSSAWCRP